MAGKEFSPLSRSELREVDRRASERYHLPGIVLMENAGRGAAELLFELGIVGRVVICAGKGNNGGDGFVIARHLEIAGVATQILLFCDPEELSGDAAANYQVLRAANAAIIEMCLPPDVDRLIEELATADWIVDALLGTGIRGELREPYPAVISAINESRKRVLAVDLPSGMDCDTGLPLGCCVCASHTVTFVSRKIGFENPDSISWTGYVHIAGIGVPRQVVAEIVAEREKV